MKKLAAFLLTATVVVTLSILASPFDKTGAIPSKVGHSHAAADVTWSAAALGDPNVIAHQHRSTHNFYGATGNTPSGNPYDAYQVWDNTQLRKDDVGTFLDGHGFINAGQEPSYCIDATVPPEAKPIIDNAFAQWSSISSDSPTLVMGLAFKKVDPCPGAFIEVRVTWENIASLGKKA